jgi:hypothetical protein
MPTHIDGPSEMIAFRLDPESTGVTICTHVDSHGVSRQISKQLSEHLSNTDVFRTSTIDCTFWVPHQDQGSIERIERIINDIAEKNSYIASRADAGAMELHP